MDVQWTKSSRPRLLVIDPRPFALLQDLTIPSGIISPTLVRVATADADERAGTALFAVSARSIGGVSRSHLQPLSPWCYRLTYRMADWPPPLRSFVLFFP